MAWGHISFGFSEFVFKKGYIKIQLLPTSPASNGSRVYSHPVALICRLMSRLCGDPAAGAALVY